MVAPSGHSAVGLRLRATSRRPPLSTVNRDVGSHGAIRGRAPRPLRRQFGVAVPRGGKQSHPQLGEHAPADARLALGGPVRRVCPGTADDEHSGFRALGCQRTRVSDRSRRVRLLFCPRLSVRSTNRARPGYVDVCELRHRLLSPTSSRQADPRVATTRHFERAGTKPPRVHSCGAPRRPPRSLRVTALQPARFAIEGARRMVAQPPDTPLCRSNLDAGKLRRLEDLA